MISGVLVVDKPEGLTSHDVVAAARRVLGERRVGHSGTLDPLATGVLALAVGPATRLVRFLAGDTKDYRATVRFGIETDTCDATGRVASSSPLRPTLSDVETALHRFRGSFAQLPPAYSAKRVGGVRAYTAARRASRGEAPLPLAPVAVTVDRLELTRFDGERADLSMTVSAGFYVRALARDLGGGLGMGAVLEALRRTRSGQFDIDAALPFEELVQDSRSALERRVVAPEKLLAGVPALSLSSESVRRVRHGLDVPHPTDWPGAPPLVRLLDDSGQLLALAVPARVQGLLHPCVVLG